MTAHRMDHRTVERLLGGLVVEPRDGSHPVAAVLTAARAAPRAEELTGEDAAVRAYRLARAGTPLPVPGPRRRPALARLGVRAALAGGALALTGGVALAATGGVPQPSPRPPAPTATDAPATATDASPAAPSDRPPAPTDGVDGRPAPDESVLRLCRAYRSGADPGRSPGDPVPEELAEAAGGRDEVAGYCDRVLAGDPGRTGPPGAPGDRPGAGPPGGGPVGRATGPPPGGP
ncbi:hypothetical protein, partial [Micromonospora sp. CPCC 205561]|uniref:hypothetical protein n=1 Tax=Micromonospora sp. CPCC 205561 TaxID=3122407 RepID=UPI002FEE973D